MKFLPILLLLAVVCLAVAAGEASVDMCNPQRTPTKLIARRTWPGQTATTAKPTTVTTTSSPSTTTPTTTTMATTTTPLPILFNCSVDNPACGTMCTNLTSGGGVVQSPNFPADYGNYERNCQVTITPPAGWMITMKFTAFNVETGKASFYLNDNGGILLHPTGNTIPALVPATTDLMNIMFNIYASSKPSTAVYNWQATFSMTSQGSSCYVQDPACGPMCANVTSSGSGVVQSPNFPYDFGNSNRECKVTIVVPAGKRIRLEFPIYNLENYYSSINIIEQGTFLNFLSPSPNGTLIPAAVTSTTNKVYLAFATRSSTKPSTAVYNWQATYTAV